MRKLLEGKMEPVIHLKEQQTEYDKLPKRIKDSPRDNLLRSGVLQYLDDSLLYSDTEDGPLDVMRRFFTRMRLFGLYLKPTKCHVKKEITWLGHRISADGVAVDPDKVKCLEAIREPRNAAELQQYLAMLLWLKGRLPGYKDRKSVV